MLLHHFLRPPTASLKSPIIERVHMNQQGEVVLSISTKIAIKVLISQRSLSLIGCCLCVILGSVIVLNQQRPRHEVLIALSQAQSAPITVAAAGTSHSRANMRQMPAPVVTLAASSAAVEAKPSSDAGTATVDLHNLLIPVEGVSPNQLRDSFYDARSEGRVHQALDIMARQDTPVLAAGDGAVMKLRQSDRGGTMLYQSDPSGSYVFYYGHLSRFADGMVEGRKLKRGEVIGYVGDTGNAGPGNFHLHFGISKVTTPGRWYGGEPINPYPLLHGDPTPSVGGK
jgi:murein DD-endopeptidase MepM/ murein hydrolase activator NlpD